MIQNAVDVILTLTSRVNKTTWKINSHLFMGITIHALIKEEAPIFLFYDSLA